MWILEDLFNGLLSLVVSALMALVYPFVVMASLVQSVFNAFYIPVAGLINAFIGVYNMLATIINEVLGTVLPSAWVLLFLAAFLVKMGLILYRYLSDIEIVGCKV